MLCRSGIKSKESSILHEHKIPAGVLPEVPAGKQRAVLLSWRFMAELHLFVRASFTVQVTVSTVSYRPQRLRKHFLDFSNLSQDFIYIFFFFQPQPGFNMTFFNGNNKSSTLKHLLPTLWGQQGTLSPVLQTVRSAVQAEFTVLQKGCLVRLHVPPCSLTWRKLISTIRCESVSRPRVNCRKYESNNH